MAIITTNKNDQILVDTQYYDFLNQWKWQVNPQGYAIRTALLDNRKYNIYMHRQITGALKSGIIDHINRNKLDNRISNLRIVTLTTNNYNSKKKGKTSRFRGVHKDTRTGNFAAQITIDGKIQHIGTYKTEELAYEAYTKVAKQFIKDALRE